MLSKIFLFQNCQTPDNKTINGKYGNTTIEEMKNWNNDTIVQNLGNGFKKNRNSNVNQGLPILVWQ